MGEQNDVPTPDELLNAAIGYAAAGLKIYPVFIRGLRPDGKKDVHVPIRSWREQATDDLDQIYAWWDGQYRGAGIGVDMGRSHLAVADADVKDGVDGITRLNYEIRPAMREAPASLTPSGGLHAWFSDPDGEMGSGSNIFGDRESASGVDGRGVGGTIFMPPTFVPGYGRYAWADGRPPEWTELPRVPARLAAACPPGGKKKERAAGTQRDAAVRSAGQQGYAGSQLFAAPPVVHRDRAMPLEAAKARLVPLWERVRDTKSPNGVWQAVADFARAAAHYQCFWDQATVERMVLAAYAEGGHGYGRLDGDDLRAIAGGYTLQAEARAAGDLDEGWVATPAPGAEALAAATEAVPDDAVEALLAEMLTPAQIKDRPGKQYLIKGLLNLDSESWVIGAPGSRKSFVVLDMAAHVAAGQPWQGRRVAQGPVVIIAAEGAGGLSARIAAWEREHGRPMPESVHVLPRPVQVANAAAWAVLVKACERLSPVMVVIDTQARVTAGLDENSSQLGVFVDAMTAVRNVTGACVLAVHHTSKAGQDARGHSVIDGAQDTELKVVAGKEPLRGELRTEKQKDLPELAPLKLVFAVHAVGVDEDGEAITSLALRGQDAWMDADAEPVQAEPWEAGHAEVIVQIFKVLRDQGGVAGLTKSEARAAVVELHYGNDTKALPKSTWYTGWDRAREKVSASSGDPVMVSAGGQRWTIDPAALKDLAPRAAE